MHKIPSIAARPLNELIDDINAHGTDVESVEHSEKTEIRPAWQEAIDKVQAERERITALLKHRQRPEKNGGFNPKLGIKTGAVEKTMIQPMANNDTLEPMAPKKNNTQDATTNPPRMEVVTRVNNAWLERRWSA